MTIPCEIRCVVERIRFKEEEDKILISWYNSTYEKRTSDVYENCSDPRKQCNVETTNEDG